MIHTSVALYLVAQVFFLFNIQYPSTLNFDEFHYIPSAKQYLSLSENQNWEHPPLGKLLIAVGIGALGDHPLGWRVMSTVFGALTLGAMYFFALSIFRKERTALWVALLTLFNQLLYVQSRIAMLDTFMCGFLFSALAFFCSTWDSPLSRKTIKKRLLTSGLLFGLAVSCKWFALIPWLACISLVLLTRTLQSWKTHFGNQKKDEDDFFRNDLWKGIRLFDWVWVWVIAPFGIYFLTFIPLFLSDGINHGWTDFFDIQVRMWSGQLRVVTQHPYNSHWSDWPLLTRPIWYAFDRDPLDQSWVRGVLLIGNPAVMWAGLAAIFVCCWDFIVTRSRMAFLISFFYFVFLVCWIVIPRKIAFYYYYYPAGMMLSLALAYTFDFSQLQKKYPMPRARWVFLMISISLFVYFFPVLAALRIPVENYRDWMWFQTWI
jgi:dolichyl-phosphate-mannose-protein mannosyltransferase